MCNSWGNALKMYNWTVNLRHFTGADNYSTYFNRTILPHEVVQFEDTFRRIIDDNGSFEVAGEVCFWKNYGNIQARSKLTQSLLTHLVIRANWDTFIRATREISNNPSFANFLALRNACNQPRGFATPITFLAFYNPKKFPMVDKHIANWWRTLKARYGYDQAPVFSQREDGWIHAVGVQRNIQNWDAYIAWKTFCCDYSKKIQKNCELDWRARDVEIAVWMAQQNGLDLTVFQ